MNIRPQFLMPSSPEMQLPIVYVKDEAAWEYKRVERDTANDETPLSEDELNAMGKEGWELVGVIAASARAYFYFKRLS